MLLTNTDPDPWCGAPRTFWRNNDLSPQRFAEREALVQQSAKELKIAEAIEFGRMYGLASQMYSVRRQAKMERQLKRQVVTSAHW